VTLSLRVAAMLFTSRPVLRQSHCDVEKMGLFPSNMDANRNVDVTKIPPPTPPRHQPQMPPPTAAPKFHTNINPRWLPPQLHYHFHGNVLNLIAKKWYALGIATSTKCSDFHPTWPPAAMFCVDLRITWIAGATMMSQRNNLTVGPP